MSYTTYASPAGDLTPNEMPPDDCKVSDEDWLEWISIARVLRRVVPQFDPTTTQFPTPNGGKWRTLVVSNP